MIFFKMLKTSANLLYKSVFYYFFFQKKKKRLSAFMHCSAWLKIWHLRLERIIKRSLGSIWTASLMEGRLVSRSSSVKFPDCATRNLFLDNDNVRFRIFLLNHAINIL